MPGKPGIYGMQRPASAAIRGMCVRPVYAWTIMILESPPCVAFTFFCSHSPP